MPDLGLKEDGAGQYRHPDRVMEEAERKIHGNVKINAGGIPGGFSPLFLKFVKTPKFYQYFY